jgi:hypothetical protein
MTPVTRERLRRIVSFLQETQLASIKQICAATALPDATVRPILAFQILFACKKVAGQPDLFSLRDPSSATVEEAPAPEPTRHARRRKRGQK